MAEKSASANAGKAQTPASKIHGCACMTGTKTACPGQTEGSFARGHDARMSSRLAQAVSKGELGIEDAVKHLRTAGGGDLLENKLRRAAERLSQANGKAPRKAAAPKAPKAPKAASKDEAETEALAQATGGRNKVTVYHGKRKFDATVVTDAAGDTVARHRFAGKDCDHDLDV